MDSITIGLKEREDLSLKREDLSLERKDLSLERKDLSLISNIESTGVYYTYNRYLN